MSDHRQIDVGRGLVALSDTVGDPFTNADDHCGRAKKDGFRPPIEFIILPATLFVSSL